MAETEQRRQVCQKCRSLIDPDASVCPECGKQPYPSRSNVAIVGFIIGAMVLIVLLAWFFSRT